MYPHCPGAVWVKWAKCGLYVLFYRTVIFQVPLEVFDYIDQGRNPQLYTKDCMEKAHSKNEDLKGKIDAYRMFKARLLVELTHVFPKEMALYRAQRGDERSGI